MEHTRYDQPAEAIASLQGIFDLTFCEWEVMIRVADDLTNTEVQSIVKLITSK